jgi:hypothetical protein
MLANAENQASVENSGVRTSISPTGHYDWRKKYLEVLWERDRAHLSRLIKEAEVLILSRERELFFDMQAHQEKTAIVHALHSLHALRRCFGLEETHAPQTTFENS